MTSWVLDATARASLTLVAVSWPALGLAEPVEAVIEPRPALASAPQPELEHQVLEIAACEPVFGDPEAWAQHRLAREELLLEVASGEHEIELVHTGPWTEPSPVEFTELELVGVVNAEAGPPLALVHVDASFEAQDCAEGYYLLAPDMSIGDAAVVLAVLDQLVLVELEGELRYLRSPYAPPPDWRMVWQSSWSFVLPKNYGKASPKPRPSSKASKPARRKR